MDKLDRVRAAVLTVSDRASRGEVEDKGGPRVAELLEAQGRISVLERQIVGDNLDLIRTALERLASSHDLVVTTGGTGLSPRDLTPEATLAVIDRRLPGMEEAMRAEGRSKTPLSMLSRAVAGHRGACLIVNLPGSPKGVEDGLRAILAAVPHAVEVLRREIADCKPAREPFER